MAYDAASRPIKVLVTGASGRTGALVVKELLKLPDDFDVCVSVRSDKAHKLMLDLGVTPGDIFRLDIADNDEQTISALKVALHGCQALIICTSAVPEPQMLASLLGGFGMWIASKMPHFGRQQAGPNTAAPFIPVTRWKGGQTPEQVDWQGQVAQIDAAKAVGTVQHIVLVSSAGGCNPKHFLNYIGQGDILNWKRLAEQHLIASGITYTILHPNHLVDALTGCHQIVLGVDDEFQKPHWQQRLKMPRGDLAVLAVQSLLLRDQGEGQLCTPTCCLTAIC
eukprot:GHUV01043475.1.p1 GENE.GHUV01043475.1~~GHUV01043475.1.p1  ORF type:complete len:280 (+),score=73.80 GHUV01043475.1:34-873(+)